jgi:hypothetical protein
MPAPILRDQRHFHLIAFRHNHRSVTSRRTQLFSASAPLSHFSRVTIDFPKNVLTPLRDIRNRNSV